MLHNGVMKSDVKKESAFDNEPKGEDVKAESAKTVSKKKFANKTFLMWGLIAVVAVAGLGSGAYYYTQYRNTQKLLKNSVLGTQIEAEKIVEKVAKMVELPADKPTIATVSDVSKLKNQQFFTNAQNGDKVLIYQKAKKAILYRPSTNKIVEFGPINLGSPAQNSASPSAAVSLKPVKIALYNGTTTAGLANAVEKDFVTKAPNVTVISKGNAAKRDYAKTLVVDVTGSNKLETQNIANLLQGSLGKLPVGEKATSSADILVILGRP